MGQSRFSEITGDIQAVGGLYFDAPIHLVNQRKWYTQFFDFDNKLDLYDEGDAAGDVARWTVTSIGAGPDISFIALPTTATQDVYGGTRIQLEAINTGQCVHLGNPSAPFTVSTGGQVGTSSYVRQATDNIVEWGARPYANGTGTMGWTNAAAGSTADWFFGMTDFAGAIMGTDGALDGTNFQVAGFHYDQSVGTVNLAYGGVNTGTVIQSAGTLTAAQVGLGANTTTHVSFGVRLQGTRYISWYIHGTRVGTVTLSAAQAFVPGTGNWSAATALCNPAARTNTNEVGMVYDYCAVAARRHNQSSTRLGL